MGNRGGRQRAGCRAIGGSTSERGCALARLGAPPAEPGAESDARPNRAKEGTLTLAISGQPRALATSRGSLALDHEACAGAAAVHDALWEAE